MATQPACHVALFTTRYRCARLQAGYVISASSASQQKHKMDRFFIKKRDRNELKNQMDRHTVLGLIVELMRKMSLRKQQTKISTKTPERGRAGKQQV